MNKTISVIKIKELKNGFNKNKRQKKLIIKTFY